MAEASDVPQQTHDIPRTETITTAFNDMFQRVIANPITIKLIDASIRDGDITIGSGEWYRGEENIVSCLNTFKKVMDRYGFDDRNYKIGRVFEYGRGQHLKFPEVGTLRSEEGETTSNLHPGVVIHSKVYRDKDNGRVLACEWEAANEKAIDESLPPKFKKRMRKDFIKLARVFEKAGISTGLSFPRKNPIEEFLDRVKKKK